MPDVARLMLMTPRGEGMPLPGKDVLLVRLGACSGVCAHAARVRPVLPSSLGAFTAEMAHGIIHSYARCI